LQEKNSWCKQTSCRQFGAATVKGGSGPALPTGLGIVLIHERFSPSQEEICEWGCPGWGL